MTSNVIIEQQLRLTFLGLTESEMLSIRSHYIGQQGRFLSFFIPPNLLSGMTTPAYFTPTGYSWIYGSAPQVEDIPGTQRYNVSVELVTIPPEGANVNGAELTVSIALAAGIASALGDATGFELTVTASIEGGVVADNSSAGFELTVTASLAAGVATGGGSALPTGPFTGDVLISTVASPYIRVYPYTTAAGWGTLYSAPASPPTVAVDSAVFAADGSAIFVGQRATPFISAYAWTSGTGFGTKYSDPATVMPGTTTPDMVSAPNSSVIFAISSSSPFVNAYPWSSATGFGAKYANPSVLPTSPLTSIACSPTGNAVSMTRNNSTAPFQVQTYAFNAATGFGAAYSNPSVTGAGSGVKWNYTGDVIFAATSGGAYLYAWPWSDATGFGAAYSAPTVSPTFTPRDKTLAIAPDSSTVLIGKSSAPQFRVWAFDKVTGWGAELSSITMGTSNGLGSNIAVTGDAVFLNANSTGFGLTAYDWSSSGVGTSRGTILGGGVSGTKIDSFHNGT
jgi:hypothetical protein